MKALFQTIYLCASAKVSDKNDARAFISLPTAQTFKMLI